MTDHEQAIDALERYIEADEAAIAHLETELEDRRTNLAWRHQQLQEILGHD